MKLTRTMLAGAALCTPVLVWSAGPLLDGNWEVTTKMEMPGMPFAMPAQKHNQCVTSKDSTPDVAPKDQKCEMLDQKMAGDTYTWRMQCTGKNGVTDTDGRIKYAGKSYDGEMNMRMPGGPSKSAKAAKADEGAGMSMKMTIQGRYTGSCQDAAAKTKKAGDY